MILDMDVDMNKENRFNIRILFHILVSISFFFTNTDQRNTNRGHCRPPGFPFSHYCSVLKKKAIVDEAEKLLKDFKPVTCVVSEHIKTIEAFEAKAVSTAKETEEKIDVELGDLQATQADIEEARPFQDLTVLDIGEAHPRIIETVETMMKKGKWSVPGYKEKFGDLNLISTYLPSQYPVNDPVPKLRAVPLPWCILWANLKGKRRRSEEASDWLTRGTGSGLLVKEFFLIMIQLTLWFIQLAVTIGTPCITPSNPFTGPPPPHLIYAQGPIPAPYPLPPGVLPHPPPISHPTAQQQHPQLPLSRPDMNIIFDSNPKHLPSAGVANVKQFVLSKTSTMARICRTYCEGGWTGPIPTDSRDVDVL
ncbi:hypothetical protein C8R41DRAFT_862232 [Lentinula lateritia]|uniref:ATP synthase subunit d, mitochondrial n=1 Tax=Lentinula lateritia TaxID=40482 RepID=A0ABQ8W2R8_9AGAR|nr:hypothetical protein C8R41DRAFT_862232 [Lentinula lateritia]